MPFLKDKSEYAVSTWTLYTKPLDTALALIRDAGFEAVEIWADSIHLDPRLKPDVAKVRGLVRENGQHVHSLHSPVLYGAFPHPQEEKAFREHRKAILKETLDYASELESPIVVIHGHHGKYYPYTMNDADVLCDTIAELADHGKKRGVRLAMENLPHDPGENGITWSLRFQSQLYKALDVGYCLDIGHTPIVGDGDNFTEIDAVAEKPDLLPCAQQRRSARQPQPAR